MDDRHEMEEKIGRFIADMIRDYGVEFAVFLYAEGDGENRGKPRTMGNLSRDNMARLFGMLLQSYADGTNRLDGIAEVNYGRSGEGEEGSGDDESVTVTFSRIPKGIFGGSGSGGDSDLGN